MRMKKQQKAAGMLLGILAAGICMTAAAEEGKTSKSTLLTGLVFQSVADSVGLWSGAGAEKLEEDTGIRLEFYSNGGGNTQKLLQYLAAGTLPDIVGVEESQAVLLENAGLLVNLDTCQDQLGSVFENAVYTKALDYIREQLGGTDGGLYLLPVEVGKQAKEDYEWLPMVQWKPYVQAGCPAVNTLEDFLDAAEQMLRYKSSTPLGENVYAFSLYSDQDDCIAKDAANLSRMYGKVIGTICPVMELDVATGELISVTDDDSFYKQALYFYFQANQRGLLDPDSQNQTYETLKEKYADGRVLFSKEQALTEQFNQDAGERGVPENAYTPLIAENMVICKDADKPVGNSWYFGVSTTGSQTEDACQLLNWLYDSEKISWLYEHPEDLQPFQALGISRTEAGVLPEPVYCRELLPGEENNPKGYEETMTVEEWLESRNMILKENEAVNMLPEVSSAMRSKCTRIGQVVREMSWNMIYAQSEEQFQDLWNQMQSRSQMLGIDIVSEYYQSIWKVALMREKTYGENK